MARTVYFFAGSDLMELGCGTCYRRCPVCHHLCVVIIIIIVVVAVGINTSNESIQIILHYSLFSQSNTELTLLNKDKLVFEETRNLFLI